MINSGVTVPLVSPVDTESTKIEQKPASVIQEKKACLLRSKLYQGPPACLHYKGALLEALFIL
jgi:hypothetical protein